MDAPYNFKKMGYPTKNFLNNLSSIISLAVLVSMLIPIISALKILIPTNRFMANSDSFIRGRFLITILNFIYLKLVLFTFMNFESFSTETFGSALNSFASIFGLILIALLPIYYIF